MLRFELTLTQGLITASNKVEKDEPQAETTISILKNVSHVGVENITVVKKMYIDFKIKVSQYAPAAMMLLLNISQNSTYTRNYY